MGDLLELIPASTDRFEIFSMESELVRAYEDPATKRKMFRGVASSTTKDLHGDTITLSALQDMERSAVGLTMFLNHSYDVPDDVGGTITKAIIKQKGADQNGDPNYQLEIEGEVEEDNSAALQTWKFVQKGRKIGLSIGAMIPANGAKRQKDGTYIIEHIDLLEVSFVGIPANPKSWVEYAASALRGLTAKGQTHALGNPVLTIEGKNYRIEGSMESLSLNLGDEPEVIEPEIQHTFTLDAADRVEITQRVNKGGESSSALLGAWDLSDDDDRLMAIATVGEDVVSKATVWVTTRDGDQITIGEPSPDVENGGEADVTKDAVTDPDVTDAKVRIIEVDTDDKPSSNDEQQGASSSEPADETLSAPEADVTAAADEPDALNEASADQLMRLSFAQLQGIALRAVTELVTAKRALHEEQMARKAAEDALEAVMELVVKTNQTLEMVAASPLPRKAVLKGIQTAFSTSIENTYGKDIADVIRRRA